MDFHALEQRALEELAGGHRDAALEMLQEASEAALQGAGALSRPSRLQVLIAQLRLETGDLGGAREALLEAFPGLRAPDGTIETEVAERMAKVLGSMVSQSEAGEAARLLDQIVELRALQFGAEHPITLAAMHRKAEVMYEQGAFRLAEQTACEVVDLRTRILGPGNPLCAASRVLYARTLEARQKPAEAFVQYDRAHEILSAALGGQHAQTQMALQNRERLRREAAPPEQKPAAPAPAWPVTVPGGLWQAFEGKAETPPRPAPAPPPPREAPKPVDEPLPPRRARVQASWAGEGPVTWFGERGRPRESSDEVSRPPGEAARPARAEWKPEPSQREEPPRLQPKAAQTEEMVTRALFTEGGHRNLQIADKSLVGAIHASQHLIVHGASAILLDPGGPKVYPRVLSEVLKALGRDTRLDKILLSHQDPDCVSAINSWMMSCEAEVWLSRLWHRFVPHFGLDPRYWGRMHGIPDEGLWVDLGGAPLAFLPAHFLHSPGNFHVWDPTSRILYTGDVGAADDCAEGEVVDFDGHIGPVAAFHERYMASARAVVPWLAMVRKLDVAAIVPHHGRIFRGPMIARFLDWCATLRTGMERMPDAYALPPAR